MIDKFINNRKSIKDFNSHSYISLKHQYFFHSIGKAANSTVKHFLYTEELKGSGFKYKTVHDRLGSPLISPFQLKDDYVISLLKNNDCFKFTFVRNPLSRLLSCYLDRIQNLKSAPYKELARWANVDEGYEFSFSEFINLICDQTDAQQNNHWRVQYTDALCEIIEYDFLGRQESFSDDMVRVWSSVFKDRPVPVFSSINKSPSKTGSSEKLYEFWSDGLLAKVVDRYEKDFNYFGYDKRL